MISDLSEDAVVELLTLDCEIDKYGNKLYRNKNGDLHRIHGPAIITSSGSYYWYRNGVCHREDGPAKYTSAGLKSYWIGGKWLTKEEFIQWQKDNGINPIK